MNKTIESDFADFINNEGLFNSSVKLYDSQGGTLKFEGKGIWDKKPQLVENESGQVSYSGHKSMLTLTMSELTFMPSYFDLKNYFVEITDNVETKSYLIEISPYNSNVNAIYCELKEVEITE
jgi:hypothetical protein